MPIRNMGEFELPIALEVLSCIISSLRPQTNPSKREVLVGLQSWAEIMNRWNDWDEFFARLTFISQSAILLPDHVRALDDKEPSG